jgi:hypothetical protein
MPIMYIRPPGSSRFPQLGQDDSGETPPAAPPPANVMGPGSQQQQQNWWTGQTFGMPNYVLVGGFLAFLILRRPSRGSGSSRRYRD